MPRGPWGEALNVEARLECASCGRSHNLSHWEPCECGGSLLVDYELEDISKRDLKGRRDLWRYLPLLPVEPEHVTTLGEGWTPLRPLEERNLAESDVTVYLKDEGFSPTATFKARGMALAVSMARQQGFQRLTVPSAGNAGVALAAYAAAAEMEALVIAPQDTPPALLREIVTRGARCVLVTGPIDEAGLYAREAAKAGWLNLSTLREPYRVEGKKTMGFEIWEQLGDIPDWVVFPTGGGTGVVGLWKAFKELARLGWTDGKMPHLCAVQSSGCAPLSRAWASESREAPDIQRPRTIAVGLRVPRPSGLPLIMRVVEESRGIIIDVSEEGIPKAATEFGSHHGIYPCFEGAAAYLGMRALVRERHVSKGDTVVLFNTGLGLINPELQASSLPLLRETADLEAFLQV